MKADQINCVDNEDVEVAVEVDDQKEKERGNEPNRLSPSFAVLQYRVALLLRKYSIVDADQLNFFFPKKRKVAELAI